MALPARLKTLDEIGDKYQELYRAATDKEGDGFVLDVLRVDNWALEDVHGLRSGLQKARAGETLARKDVAAFREIADEQGTDLEGLPAMIRDAYARAANPKTPETDALLAAEKERHAAEVTKLKGENTTLRTGFAESQVDATLVAEIAKAKGSQDLLLPILQGMVKPITAEDGKTRVVPVDKHGNPRLTEASGETSDMPISELLQTLRNDDRYAAAFAGNGVSGTGTTTAGAGRSVGSSTFESIPVTDPAGRMAAASREVKARGGS